MNTQHTTNPGPLQDSGQSDEQHAPSRRSLVAGALMVLGIVAGYGAGLWQFFQYLVPLGSSRRMRPMFIGTLAQFPPGSSITVSDPRGEEIVVARPSDDPDDPARGFKALSSVCPHLGCKVHWEAANGHFLCPCHQGIFDKSGAAVSGPPAKEGQDLSTFDVVVNSQTGWVFVMVSEAPRYGV